MISTFKCIISLRRYYPYQVKGFGFPSQPLSKHPRLLFGFTRFSVDYCNTNPRVCQGLYNKKRSECSLRLYSAYLSCFKVVAFFECYSHRKGLSRERAARFYCLKQSALGDRLTENTYCIFLLRELDE